MGSRYVDPTQEIHSKGHSGVRRGMRENDRAVDGPSMEREQCEKKKERLSTSSQVRAALEGLDDHTTNIPWPGGHRRAVSVKNSAKGMQPTNVDSTRI
ncbi:hypothetical protein Q1695_015945 [Nippostrongylus brasiliensis]|nr:hypothetical protein Q1695_015945 [Nippostrongylus brasiliensis]